MDAYTVQTYVANWLNGGAITGLDKAWPAQPNSLGLSFADYGSGMMRCQAFAVVDADTNVRRSTPAANPAAGTPGKGYRLLRYSVRISLCHWSADPNWTAAEQALKQAIVGGVRDRIHADPTLGTSALSDPLFNSAGEGRRGIQTEYEDPFVRESDGNREQWAHLSFDVLAWIQA